MQMAAPEAMAKVEQGEHFIESTGELEKYDALGIGPGLGQHESHILLLEQVFKCYGKPIVIDADALNMLGRSHTLLSLIPNFSILTPHPAEFDRIFGKQENDFARMRLARQKAKEHQFVIVLKGHRTLIAMPGGNCFFNSTGNPGMATGGSGDVLTGMLTGLLAQDYPPDQAAILGVYLHGLAGDLAARDCSEEAMVAGDITSHVGKAYQHIQRVV
jgi:NAD(P)H-hydrate epimerase